MKYLAKVTQLQFLSELHHNQHIIRAFNIQLILQSRYSGNQHAGLGDTSSNLCDTYAGKDFIV